ncbi:MAG: hypothetical protein EXS68_02325 [Candidatus Ryanbacteria bacterium]|nr:hypothetical protein [Candidatus Ryanbacteria bacterium]
MQDKIILGGIIGIGLAVAVVLGFLNGNLALTRFEQYRDDAAFYNEKALLLLDQGSLRDDISHFRKPPLYPAFLAVSYGALGRRPLSTWVTQAFLYVLALVLLYRISLFFLSGKFAFLPPLAYALFWVGGFYVFKIGSETLAIFLLLGITYIGLLHARAPSKTKSAAWAVAYGLLTLTKPIALYSMPISLVLLLVSLRHHMPRKSIFQHAAIIGAFFIVIVGGWMLRNQYYLNDYQIEQTGHVFWVKGVASEASYRDLAAYTVAGLFGDHIADAVFTGYADQPFPLIMNGRAKRLWADLDGRGLSDFEIDKYFHDEGIAKLKDNIFGIGISSIPSIFEINAPTNHRGFSLAHFLTGTHEDIPSLLRILIILTIRVVWLMMLGVVAFGCVRAVQRDVRSWFMVWMVFYFNAMHVLILIPAETRYIAPVIPFYIFFGVYAAWRLRCVLVAR